MRYTILTPAPAFLQALSDPLDAEFRAIIVRVVVVGLLAVALGTLLIFLFWRNLEKESAGGERETRVSTFVLLVVLVVVMFALSFGVYSLA